MDKDESSFGDCCSSKLADIFVASFEISFEEQLSMLDSVDPKVRLSKATELVDRHLQVSNSVNDASDEFVPFWFSHLALCSFFSNDVSFGVYIWVLKIVFFTFFVTDVVYKQGL